MDIKRKLENAQLSLSPRMSHLMIDSPLMMWDNRYAISYSLMKTLLKPAPIGSISHGTLRTIDLLESFMSELEWQIKNNGHFFSLPENSAYRDMLNNIVGKCQDCCWNEDGDDIDPEKEDEAEMLVNETLPDSLSDFGFWPSWDAINELPCVDDSDEAKEIGEDCRFVNDHGNTTIYNGDGVAILELV